MKKIEINPKKLYEGCILSMISHAVTVGEYTDLKYEHSWDGINYSMNNSEGSRGTITFHDKYIIAAFRDDEQADEDIDALRYFEGAEDEIIKLAKEETLMYLLDDVNGETKPLITAAFWGTWEKLDSNQTLDEIMENSAGIIENEISDYKTAIENLDENYEFHDGQRELIESLFKRKLESGFDKEIKLSKKEKDFLYGDIGECKESLAELNISL